MDKVQMLNDIMSYKKFKTKSEFARFLGISTQNLAAWFSRNTYNVNILLMAFPDLNPEWLLTGKGDMLIPEEDEMIRRGKELDEEDYHKAIAIGLPLIPEREVAFRGGDEGEINLSSPIIAYWHIPNTPKNSEIVTVYGNSMHPKIPSGSRIVVYPYFFNPNEPTTIEFGRIFAIVVEDGTTGEYKAFIKYLRRHPDKALERKYWIARSENREEYDDFEIEVSQVRRLFAVESIISTIR